MADEDDRPEGPKDPAVAAALDRLRTRDPDAAEAAAAAWGWVAPEGEADRVHQRFVQDFVWYRLPVKWWTDEREHLEITEGLAGLFDELGMGRYAELCRSATTREVIGAWYRGEKAGLAAYRKAVDGSGIDAPGGRFVFPLLTVLETFGLHVEHDAPGQGRFDRLTDAGRATALEALRVRATGPQHRLLD